MDARKDPRISTDVNLFDFFHQQVHEACDGEAIRLSDDGSLYLAQLLADRAHTDNAPPMHDTLAELHARALQGSPSEQARTWRALGDRALYDLGQFREHLQKKVVPLSYYEAMGASAYRRADEVLARFFARAFGDVFGELAERFRDCVRVLERVRTRHGRDPIDALWQLWLETADEGAAARLRARGVLVPRHPSTSGSA